MTSIFYRKVSCLDVPFTRHNEIFKDPRHAKMGLMPYATSKAPAQPAHTEVPIETTNDFIASA